jgi:IS30 family transposase
VVLTGVSSRLSALETLLEQDTRVQTTTPVRERQRQHRLSPAETVALVQAYQAGAEMRELALQFGVNRHTVAAQLRRMAVPLRNQPLSQSDVAAASASYAAGWSLAKIAARLERNPTTVWKALRHAGVPMRRPWEH